MLNRWVDLSFAVTLSAIPLQRYRFIVCAMWWKWALINSTIMTAPVPRSTIEDTLKLSGTVFNNLEDETARRE